MSLEQTLYPVLVAAFAPVPVRMLHAEQLSDLKPADVPLVVFSRDSSSWDAWDTFCAGNMELADITLMFNYLDLTLEGARKLADKGRATLKAQQANLTSEFDVWESSLQVYRVTSYFNLTDNSPSIT